MPFEEKFGPSRGLEAIAHDVLHAVTQEPPTGGGMCITNAEAAILAINAMNSSCPACGAERWVNIDCGLCTIACELIVWENGE